MLLCTEIPPHLLGRSEAARFRALFKGESSKTADPGVLPVASNPHEHARLASTAARQASDADFARAQIPQEIQKAWTFSPYGGNTASPSKQESLPPGTREAVERAIAAARHQSDVAFLQRTSTRQVRSGLTGAPVESALPILGTPDARYTHPIIGGVQRDDVYPQSSTFQTQVG